MYSSIKGSNLIISGPTHLNALHDGVGLVLKFEFENIREKS